MRVVTVIASFVLVAVPAAGQTVTTIASNGAAGVLTNAPLLLGTHGELYGTSEVGGSRNNAGEVFELMPPAHGQTAWTSIIIYVFGGKPDGAEPTSGLTAGPNGVLFGTTESGGANNAGAAFQLRPPSAGQTAWTEQILVSMPNSGAGGLPVGTLAKDRSGNLYGVTQGFDHTGTVFELSPPTAGQAGWQFNTLYTFTGGADGGSPGKNAGPLYTAAGYLFGTTEVGGAGPGAQGTIWRLNPPNTKRPQWTETTLATFNGTSGSFAEGGLVKAPNGSLYGTTSGGGATGNGTVYQLVPPVHGGVEYTLNTIWSFVSGAGSAPESTLTMDAAGNLFGTTAADGGYGATGNGTIFKLAPPSAGSTAWQFTTLYTFPAGNQGGLPGQLTPGHKGVLYGSSAFGGTDNCGYQPTGCGTAFMVTGSGY